MKVWTVLPVDRMAVVVHLKLRRADGDNDTASRPANVSRAPVASRRLLLKGGSGMAMGKPPGFIAAGVMQRVRHASRISRTVRKSCIGWIGFMISSMPSSGTPRFLMKSAV